MKKTLKLVPALAMLLISAILVSTSTYAWFSMNNTVTVTGMTVKTEVNNNLLIANALNGDGTTPAGTPNPLNAPIAAMPDAADYGTHTVQEVGGLLEPVSTTTAAYNDFWYTSTKNVVSSGDAKQDVYVAYNPANTTAFDTNYNTSGAKGYYDYVFAIQATNTDSDSTAKAYVNMTKCDLTYKGAATSEKAFRVAVLVQSVENGSANTTPTLITILTPESAANFTHNDSTSKYKAVKDDDELADVTYNTAATIGEVTGGATVYFKVTVRLWLEGEDNTCNNATFATLTSDYDLDLKFELQSATTGAVQNINKANKAAGYYSVAVATTTDGDTVVLSGITYYPFEATVGSETKTIYADTETKSASTKWFTITGVEVYEITEFVNAPLS